MDVPESLQCRVFIRAPIPYTRGQIRHAHACRELCRYTPYILYDIDRRQSLYYSTHGYRCLFRV